MHKRSRTYTMGSSDEDDHSSGDQVEDGDGDDAPNALANADAKVPFEDTPSEAPLSTTSTWAEDSELRPGLNKVSVVDKGWKVKAKLAPRMSSLAEGTDDEDGLAHSGMPGAIQGKPCIRTLPQTVTPAHCALAPATHAFFSICGLTHGDISPANICFYYDKEGNMVGVINDFDHHRAEEIRPHAR